MLTGWRLLTRTKEQFYSVRSQDSTAPRSGCPRMSPYFFLSCAPADKGPIVRRFFDDLSDSIRISAGLPPTEVVGCCEAFEQNAIDREEGLRTASLMLALLSPDYFRDKKSGREWQIFEMR